MRQLMRQLMAHTPACPHPECIDSHCMHRASREPEPGVCGNAVLVRAHGDIPGTHRARAISHLFIDAAIVHHHRCSESCCIRYRSCEPWPGDCVIAVQVRARGDAGVHRALVHDGLPCNEHSLRRTALHRYCPGFPDHETLLIYCPCCAHSGQLVALLRLLSAMGLLWLSLHPVGSGRSVALPPPRRSSRQTAEVLHEPG